MVQHLRSGKALPNGPFEPPQYKKTGRGHLLFSAATFLFLQAVSWLHRLEDGISQVFLRLPGRGEGSARPHAGGRWSETGVLGARRWPSTLTRPSV